MKITPTVYTVSGFLDLVNGQLEEMVMAVQGEITSLSVRNHAYFSLSENHPTDKAVLSCALWQFRLKTLPFELKEGMEVQVIGKANIYKPTGRFTFVVEHIIPVGEGALQKAFEELKRKLEARGYFDTSRKKALPHFPTRIGLLTSETGDAIRDFKTHLGKFGLTVVHKDIRVEGIYAIDSVVEGIRWFNEHPDIIPGGVEVLVLTRGGGSLESLQAFNSEAVAQAIFASSIPVISAIGHERDVTIADFVADVRASTPTDAGRILSENWRLAQEKLQHFSQSFFQTVERIIQQQQERMDFQWQKMTNRFFSQLESFFEKRAYFFRSVLSHFSKTLARFKNAGDSLEKQLEAHNPQRKLEQGYSIIKNTQGKIIKSLNNITEKETVQVLVADGSFLSTVAKKEL